MAKKKTQKAAPKKTKTAKSAGQSGKAKKVATVKASGKKVAGKKPVATKKTVKAKVQATPITTRASEKAAPSKNLSSVFTPLDDRVVVLRDPEETKTASGLIIPGTSAEKPTRGKVVAVGMGEFNKKKTWRRPMEVKVGERVLFSQYAGTPLQIGTLEYIIMRESDLLGIID